MVWHQRFPTRKHGGRKEGRNLKISAKRLFSEFRVAKTKFHHFWFPPLEKLLEKSSSDPPPEKILPTPYAHKHVKLHHFCKKLCCISPFGRTVQQHQWDKQAIAGWQTVHDVFCQTITKYCQITNNILQMILSKYCQILQNFSLKRFTLMDPILIVLLKLFRQNSSFKSWGASPPSEIKVWGPRPLRPPRLRHLRLLLEAKKWLFLV